MYTAVIYSTYRDGVILWHERTSLQFFLTRIFMWIYIYIYDSEYIKKLYTTFKEKDISEILDL